MSYYTFTFKNAEITLELTSEEKKTIAIQADKFISDVLALESVKQTKPASKKAAPVKEIKPEPVVEEAIEPIEVIEAPVKLKEPIIESSISASAFGDILNKKITEEPKAENEEKVVEAVEQKAKPQIQSLKSLIQTKNPQKPIDYLLLAAHYLNEVEGLKRYSLKQINTKVLTVSSTPIDHGAIQEAVVREYIEIVPDVTGMADVTEYAITDKGEFYIFNEM